MVTIGGGLVVATAGGPPVTTAGITVIVPGAQIAMGTVVSIAVRAGTLSSTLFMAANDMAAEEAKEAGASQSGGRTPYRDPQRPDYNNGKVHMDHEDAKVWGNEGQATRELPAETNIRRGGYDAKLHQEYQKLVQQLEQQGIPPAKARQMARQAVQSEIDALKNSPPPRPMDPRALDQLPENPLDQGI
jgi:hypothetical protein